MGDCDNTAKRTANRWWRRTPTKGGSLSRNGQAPRSLLFNWRQPQPNSAEKQPLMNQIDGHRNMASEHPSNGNPDSISVFLRKVIEEHVDAEHTRPIGYDQTFGLAMESAPEAASASAELPTQVPTWKKILDLTLIVLTYPIWL